MHPKLQKISPKIIEKGWGREEIICSYPELGFCGKYLVYNKIGAISSNHWHNEKSEVFKVEEGKFKLKWTNTENADEYILELNPGDTVFIPRGCPHQVTCLEIGKILEISSADRPEDNFRVGKGDSQTRPREEFKKDYLPI